MTSIPSMHSETFADFVATQQARNDIQLKIVETCLTLCDVLRANFESRNHGKVGGYAPPKYTFDLDSSGRKYHKIFMYIDGKRNSIHAFVDKKTGEVYKPSSLKAPAKGVRYNMLSIESRQEMFERADWAGGYLYKRY